jgi:hypothetical protein
MPDLVFANITDPKSVPLKPDTHRSPLRTDAYLPHVNNTLNCDFSYRNLAADTFTYFLRLIGQMSMKLVRLI